MGNKRYKVYNAGGQQMNPTAMWFAQMGAEQPSQEEMMMMQQQGAPQQDPQKQLMQLAQDISAVIQKGEEDPGSITQQLLEAGTPVEAIGQAFEMLLQQGVVDDSEMQMVAQVIQSSQGGQPSEEEMMAMQQQQAAQEPPMAKAGYINKRLKEAQAGMEQDSGFASDTNLNANKNLQKNTLLNFAKNNVMRNQFSDEYDQIYGAGLEQARFGRGRARRQARRAERNSSPNWAKNAKRRSRQLARLATRENPDIYTRGDRRALREGLYSGEFDKYDIYRGIDVFDPYARSNKPGYPAVDAGSWDQTMIPGKDWGAERSIDQMREDARAAGAYEDVTPVETPKEEMDNAGVTDDMSFSEAFATANKALGEDGVFVWKGKKYGTRRASSSDVIDADDADVTIDTDDYNPDPGNPNVKKALDGNYYDITDMSDSEYEFLYDSDVYDPDVYYTVGDDGELSFTPIEDDGFQQDGDNEGDWTDYEPAEVTPGGGFAPYNKETDGEYRDWLRSLPYNKDGYAVDSEGNYYNIDDYNRAFNRSGMNNAYAFDPFNEEAKRRAYEFHKMGYDGYTGVNYGEEDTPKGKPVPLGGFNPNLMTTMPVIEYDDEGKRIPKPLYDGQGNIVGYDTDMDIEEGNPTDPRIIGSIGVVYDEDGKRMQYGGQFSDDGLEIARFGRGRARRQARRAARRAKRQARRGMGQIDSAMRGAYGNIAFPAGVSPMLSGMPMMGPAGAGMMQFYGRRGPFGGLREFSMNMPANFSRGMFMNGIFNPFGITPYPGYNDTRYRITYPGQESEVTADEEAKKKVEGTVTNQNLEDQTKQPEEQKKEDAEQVVAEETEEGTEESGLTKNCGENASVNEAGQCQCNEGYIRNPNVKTFSCISEAELAAGKDDEDPEGSNWVYITLGVAGVAGGIWVLRKVAKKVRALVSKNPAASKTARQALLNRIVQQFPNSTKVASTTLQLPPGSASIKQTPITGTKLTKAEMQAGQQGKKAVQQTVGSTPLKGVTGSPSKGITTGPKPKLIGPPRANITGGARSFTATEKAIAKGNLQVIEGMSTQALKRLAAKHGLSTKGSKGSVARRVQKYLKGFAKAFQAGGSVSPDLYRFTGGGPRFVDYFGDGGYYEDGGYYGNGGIYEDVYDPYMPMAYNGMIAGQYRYGGSVQSGNKYKEGDVVNMTESELSAFLRAGGQVEYID